MTELEKGQMMCLYPFPKLFTGLYWVQRSLW